MISTATVNDIEDIIVLENSCFKSPLTYSFIHQDITTNQFSRYLIYKENGVVKGYIGFWLTDIANILNICVKEEYRGNYIGDALLKECINIVSDNNIKEISLDVRVSNNKAISLYKKYGFKEALVRKKYYENQEDAIVMIRSSL